MSDKWIDARERKPSKEDGDYSGCVIAWHVFQGAMITGWHQFDGNSLFTHWMPAPTPPENHKELLKMAFRDHWPWRS